MSGQANRQMGKRTNKKKSKSLNRVVSIFEFFLQKINDLLNRTRTHVNRIEWPEAKPATSRLNFVFLFVLFFIIHLVIIFGMNFSHANSEH